MSDSFADAPQGPANHCAEMIAVLQQYNADWTAADRYVDGDKKLSAQGLYDKREELRADAVERSLSTVEKHAREQERAAEAQEHLLQPQTEALDAVSDQEAANAWSLNVSPWFDKSRPANDWGRGIENASAADLRAYLTYGPGELSRRYPDKLQAQEAIGHLREAVADRWWTLSGQTEQLAVAQDARRRANTLRAVATEFARGRANGPQVLAWTSTIRTLDLYGRGNS